MWHWRIAMCVLLSFLLHTNSSAQSLRVFEEDVSVEAMSRDGNWLTGYRGVAADISAFKWSTSTGFQTIALDRGADPSFELPGIALGISNDGLIYAGHGESSLSHDSDREVFRWSDDVGWDTLTASDSEFERMSADGRAVAGNFYRDNDPVDDGDHAFHWSVDGGFVQIPEVPIPGFDLLQGWSADMSADGRIVVGFSVGDSSSPSLRKEEAFRWNVAEGTEGLGFLAPDHVGSAATAVSPGGGFVAGRSFTESEMFPFIWTEAGGMAELPNDGSYIEVRSISRDGRLILGRREDEQWFVWDEDRVLHPLVEFLEDRSSIDLPEWSTIAAVRMSDDGATFSGRGLRADDSFGDFRLTLVPEPSGLAGGVMALLVIALSRRKAHTSRRTIVNSG